LNDAVNAISIGNPADPSTKLGPMSRVDLLDKLHHQVMQSISMGAVPIAGCHAIKGPGFYYQPSILDYVGRGMPAYEEELFGPVAAIIRASDEQDAIRVANDSRYGLGGSVWTCDSKRGEQVARQIQTGTVYVNGLVKSDGMLEFANAKTIWLG
jgi:succinate-semialdehyde dehydrogenase/glutarate-semialdehyde dehydrogenase